MRRISLLCLLMVGLASCSDDTGTPETLPSDSATAQSAEAMPADTAGGMAVEADFEHIVYTMYARAGVAVPKEAQDSVFNSTVDKRKIPQEMEALVRRHDSVARRDVAEHYGISVDSLARIIEKGNKEKW